jgi:hypothetical protein
MAKMPWEVGQEQNLIYVAKTRAERTLVLVNGAQSAIDRGLHREVKKPAAEPAQAEPEPPAPKISADEPAKLALPTLDQLKEYKK